MLCSRYFLMRFLLNLKILTLCIVFTAEEAVCNSINEEAGVNQEQDHSASVPSSPSSSGGFHQFLFKGLYREDIPAQHIFGGNLEILQKICCMHQDFGFETVGWLRSKECS